MWALLSYRIISVPPHLSHPNCSISVLGHHYWQGINPPRLFRKEVYRKVPHRKVWQKLKGTYVVRKEGWFPRALSSSRRVSTLLQWKWEFVSRQVSGETWFTCSTDCTASNCRMYQNSWIYEEALGRLENFRHFWFHLKSRAWQKLHQANTWEQRSSFFCLAALGSQSGLGKKL